MTGHQFRVLYREFLFRVIDLEVLAAQGDLSKLLGQFAALLLFFGLLPGLGFLFLDSRGLAREAFLVSAWPLEHAMIATTMLVVGLFAVLSWESTFPDRRDVLVLGPLPVAARTLFLAKVAAAASALGLTVVALNAFAGLAAPLALAPGNASLLDLVLTLGNYRVFAAYWIAMLLAGAFIYGAVLTVQGAAAHLLPRRWFLRVSALLQMGAFGVLVTVYFLQPALATPGALAASEHQRSLTWLPSYWFLALFQQLNGWRHPALDPLAANAWSSLAAAVGGAAAAYALSYYRTLRQIVEEPEIVPAAGRVRWLLPRFGGGLQAAVMHFSLRTLLRSRQHRVIFAFYLGVGFAVSILFLKTPTLSVSPASGPWRGVSVAMLASTIVMMAVPVLGARVVFSLPLDLRANWTFRVLPIPGGSACLAARRRALHVLAVAPAWTFAAAALLYLWPWEAAVRHSLVLGLLGLLFTELSLLGTQKIPFTCSYLPGRSNFHLTFWICISLVMTLIRKAAEAERRLLDGSPAFAGLLAALAVAAVAARWYTARRARSEASDLQFEEAPEPAMLALELHRDGVLAVELDRQP